MPIQLSVAVGDNGQFVAELPDVLLNSVLKIEAVSSRGVDHSDR